MNWHVILLETSAVTTTAASRWDGGVTETMTAGTTRMNAAAVSSLLKHRQYLFLKRVLPNTISVFSICLFGDFDKALTNYLCDDEN